MKIVIQIIILSFIVWVFPQYSDAQESNQALKAPSKLQATVEGKEKVYSDESASVKEEIAYLKGKINELEKVANQGKLSLGDLIKFAAILVGAWVVILAAGVGAGGYAFYLWVKGEIIEEVKKSHDDAINKIRESHKDAIHKTYASNELIYSFQSWYEYKPSYFSGSREDFYLDFGIRRAERALKWADKIQEKQEPDVRKLILECKNHLACYLTERGRHDDAKKALDLAREIKGSRQQFDSPPHWDDTISFVFICFGNPVEKEEGLKLRDELLSREKELGSDFVYAVKAKYKNDK